MFQGVVIMHGVLANYSRFVLCKDAEAAKLNAESMEVEVDLQRQGIESCSPRSLTT